MPQNKNNDILASLRAVVDAGGPSAPVRSLPRPPVMDANSPMKQMKSKLLPITDEPLSQSNPIDAIFGQGSLASVGDPANFGVGAAAGIPTGFGKFKQPIPSGRRMEELVSKFSTGKPPVTTELMMDEASRMNRAAEQGYVHDVYHGTSKNFNEFSPALREGGYGSGDFGIHVSGDVKAANTRAEFGYGSDGDPIHDVERGYQVLPLKAQMNKTLQLPDMSIWKNPHNYIRKYQDARDGVSSYGAPVMNEVSDPDFFRTLADEAHKVTKMQGADEAQQMTLWQQRMKELMQDAGYDSIKYQNNIESDGALSYLLLDPRQLRSRFAKFDPAKRNSRDLLASLAAAIGTGAAVSHDPE